MERKDGRLFLSSLVAVKSQIDGRIVFPPLSTNILQPESKGETLDDMGHFLRHSIINIKGRAAYFQLNALTPGDFFFWWNYNVKISTAIGLITIGSSRKNP